MPSPLVSIRKQMGCIFYPSKKLSWSHIQLLPHFSASFIARLLESSLYNNNSPILSRIHTRAFWSRSSVTSKLQNPTLILVLVFSSLDGPAVFVSVYHCLPGRAGPTLPWLCYSPAHSVSPASSSLSSCWSDPRSQDAVLCSLLSPFTPSVNSSSYTLLLLFYGLIWFQIPSLY